MDFIKAIYWYLESPRMSPENEVVDKDNRQAPPHEYCQIDGQAPFQKGLKIAGGLSGVRGIGSHFRFSELLSSSEINSVLIVFFAFENGHG